MEKIIIPTDLSELGDFAYGIACKVAKNTGAKIEAVYVAVTPGEAVFDKEGNLKDCQDFDVAPIRKEMAEAEEKFKTWIADKPEITETKVMAGPLVETILNLIDKDGADLVAMGTEGSTGFREWTVGSIAEKIVREASVPVLTLKCNRDDMDIKDILLVSDFQDAEPLRIGAVKEIQKAFNARLHLLKINTKSDFLTNRKAFGLMHNFVEVNGLENVEFHTYCDESVEDGITNFSADHQIDFVTMGTHGRKGLGRVLRGSIAEKIVNHVYQPILTFKI
jgi:nucleotide-binding universal stress UspA family protein